jgi:hypothetical protein
MRKVVAISGCSGARSVSEGRGPSRTRLKTSVAAINDADEPAMPSDYASRYSLKQVLDLVAFVKSMDPTSRAGVTLKDLF